MNGCIVGVAFICIRENLGVAHRAPRWSTPALSAQDHYIGERQTMFLYGWIGRVSSRTTVSMCITNSKTYALLRLRLPEGILPSRRRNSPSPKKLRMCRAVMNKKAKTKTLQHHGRELPYLWIHDVSKDGYTSWSITCRECRSSPWEFLLC